MQSRETIVALTEAVVALNESSFAVNQQIARLDFFREGHGDCADNEVPDFTGSIDAATILMPAEGWFIRVTQIRFGMWRCQTWRGDKSTRETADVDVIAPSEALARTAAALKSRSLP